MRQSESILPGLRLQETGEEQQPRCLSQHGDEWLGHLEEIHLTQAHRGSLSAGFMSLCLTEGRCHQDRACLVHWKGNRAVLTDKIRISGFYEYVINTLKEDHAVRSADSTAQQGALYDSVLFPHGNHCLILHPSLCWSRERMTVPRPPLYSFACCSQLSLRPPSIFLPFRLSYDFCFRVWG